MMPEIRPMTLEDKPSIMAILNTTPEFPPSDVAIAEEVLDCYLNDPSGSGYYALVAEADSTVLGYICYGPAPLTQGTWDIYWMAVARQKQGQGIGAALLKAAEKDIKKAHGRQAVIETSSKPDYEKTLRFHNGQGYETVCRVPDFYEPGDHKLILLKRL